MDWAEKYRPAHLADLIGNKTAVLQIADWAKNWTTKSRPLLIYGKPGIGKTSTAIALANDMHWDVVELNASDQRTAAVIERIAGGSSVTASLTGSLRKLIILDEADNLQGTADRGGAKAILDCIRQARQPIILIANDLYGLSPELRARCEPVQFKAVPARSIAPRLKYLCSAEKIRCSEAALHAIAESAGGDIRSAVNMLYASAIGRQDVTDAQVHTSQKDERVSIFTLISALFGRTGDEELLRLSYDVDDTPETIEQWVEGNLHFITDEEAASRAYLRLARADEYLGYTYRRQYHTLWRYATALMLLGAADAAGGKGIHARILPPERWQKMATAKKQKAIRTVTLNRVAGMIHVPQNTLRENYLGTISMLVAGNPASYVKGMQLDADQLNFFLNDKARTAATLKAIQAEEKEKEPAKEPVRKARKEKAQKTEQVVESPPVSIPPPEDTAEKKPPAKTQSTLFDGF
jgi:replication factor C large subunit